MLATLSRTYFPSVNLLPPEAKERQQVRRRTAVVSVAGLIVLAVVGFFYYVEQSRVSDLQGQVVAQTAANDTLQNQVTALQPFEDLKESLTARQALTDTALSGDISWSNVLHELSLAVPSKAWLVSFTGTSAVQGAAVAPTTTTTQPTGLVASLSFSGNALSTRTLSALLIRLQREPGWVNAWMSSAQKGAIGGKTVWNFSSSVDLDKRNLSKRGGGSK
jgi:Tfp pilus assembly protein PilN